MVYIYFLIYEMCSFFTHVRSQIARKEKKSAAYTGQKCSGSPLQN